jgi:hypothetical protein
MHGFYHDLQAFLSDVSMHYRFSNLLLPLLVCSVSVLFIIFYDNARIQCCGSETFISDPVSDPDPAFSEFRIRIRFRIRIKTLDLNPDQKQAKTSFSQTKKQIEEEGTAFLLELAVIMKFGHILSRRFS